MAKNIAKGVTVDLAGNVVIAPNVLQVVGTEIAEHIKTGSVPAPSGEYIRNLGKEFAKAAVKDVIGHFTPGLTDALDIPIVEAIVERLPDVDISSVINR